MQCGPVIPRRVSKYYSIVLMSVERESTSRGRFVLSHVVMHTAVSFASFILTTSVERRLNTAPLGAGSTEMMQDHPLHV